MNNKKCKHCDCRTFDTVLTPELIHHGKLVCSACERFYKWIPKPKHENPFSDETIARATRHSI